jgi:hypothetical protein
MYFNVQTARKPGLRTTSQSRLSTYFLSQNAGRVTSPDCQLIFCLKMRVRSGQVSSLILSHIVGGVNGSLPNRAHIRRESGSTRSRVLTHCVALIWWFARQSHQGRSILLAFMRWLLHRGSS